MTPLSTAAVAARGLERVPDAVLRWAVPLAAIVVGLLAFGVFVVLIGQDPLTVYATIIEGGFASGFAWNNTLQRAAPLILTGLAVAIPAQAGLVVIGGEGALALGALAAAAVAVPLLPVAGVGALLAGALAAMAVGGAWFALAGVFRARRGLNETITSLLLSYVAIALFNHLVEGPLRDPASLNKPSTPALSESAMIGAMPGLDVHWGLALGVLACALAQAVLSRGVSGFALRVVGGNPRAAMMVGLPVGGLIVGACAAGGAAVGLAGAVEVMAVHGAASASVLAGYGTTGILVAFMARHQPLAIMPVAVLMGGISAAGSLLQRRLDLPDATTMVLQGLLFIAILAADAVLPRSRR